MTAVAFHFNAAEPLQYACRLLRKAVRSGSRALVCGPAPRLAELDRLMWTFEPLEFLPHWRGPVPTALPSTLARTPVVLVDQLDEAGSPDRDVLVLLGGAAPEGYQHFERVIEIVGTDPEGRDAARSRWKAYAAAGHAVQAHEVQR